MIKLGKKTPQPIKKMVLWWIIIVLCHICIYVYLLKRELKELWEVVWLFSCLLGSISANIIHGRCDFVFFLLYHVFLNNPDNESTNLGKSIPMPHYLYHGAC